MFGEPYLAWTEALVACTQYDDVVAAFTKGAFAEWVAADSISITEADSQNRIVARHGPNPPEEGTSFVLEQTPSAVVTLHAYKADGSFDDKAEERLRTSSLLARSVLKRIALELYCKRIRQHLLMTRREAQLAAFFVHGHMVTPVNGESIHYADAHWGPDELTRRLSPEETDHFWNQASSAWHNPVDPVWVEVRLDLGGGPQAIHSLSCYDGSALLLFAPAKLAPEPAGDRSILTRRQRDIMNWITEGKTSAEVAIILGISPRTVEKHLEAIFQRFGVENRVAAVRAYLDLQSGSPPLHFPFSR